MNTNELIDMLDAAAARTGLNIMAHYGSNHGDKRLFLTSNESDDSYTYATEIEDVKKFLAGLKPLPSKLDQLKKQRDQIQKEIDELGGETFICNEAE